VKRTAACSTSRAECAHDNAAVSLAPHDRVIEAVSGEDICRVLEEDPDLLEAVPADRQRDAVQELTARTVVIPTGAWPAATSLYPDGIGLLVLNGLLLRRVGLKGRYGAELLSQTDLLRPWQGENGSATLSTITGWSVIEPTRAAVLDLDFAGHLVRYPELVGRLVGRAIQRSRHLAMNMAIVHHARVDVRLHMLLWHLAGRWGRVRADGTMLPIRLTHSVLADLVAARRPTVTSALSDLSRRGLVRFVADGWLLPGEPPGELLDLEPHNPALQAPRVRGSARPIG
jgi:CRP/FNR family cyclic AMP-dependent transcriptional regulator